MGQELQVCLGEAAVLGQGQGACLLQTRLPFHRWRDHHQGGVEGGVVAPPAARITDRPRGGMGLGGGARVQALAGPQGLGPLLQELAPLQGQVGQQLAAGAAAQLEQHKGVFAEAIAHQVVNGAGVFAGVGLIGAAAFAAHLLQLEREQAPATGRKGPFDVLGHDPGQQLGRPAGLLAQGFEHVTPVFVAEHVKPELHFVGLRLAALHPGMDPAALKANREHVALAGVGPGALQPLFVAVGVDQLHPLLHPPGLLAQALVAEGGGDRHLSR